MSGAIAIDANQGGTATTGAFAGIELDNADISTQSGSITLQGRGGDTGGDQIGIDIVNGSTIESTGSGAVGES